MATTNFNIELDDSLIKQAEALYKGLGVDLTTAINIFLQKSLEFGGFPFYVRIEEPNNETLFALRESERISKSSHGYEVEDALAMLKKWSFLLCENPRKTKCS